MPARQADLLLGLAQRRNDRRAIGGVDPPAGLVPLEEIEGPEVELTAFGAELESTVELLRETGWLS